MPPANTFTRAFNLKQLEPLRTQREYGSSSGMSFPGAHSGLFFFRDTPYGAISRHDSLGYLLSSSNRTKLFLFVDEQTLQLNYLSTISTFTHLIKPAMALLLLLLGSPQIETLLLLLHTYSNSRPLTCIELVLEPTTRRDALRAFSPLATGTTRTKLTHLHLFLSGGENATPTNRPTNRPTNDDDDKENLHD